MRILACIALALLATPPVALAQTRTQQVSLKDAGASSGQAYFEFQVEKPVLSLPDNPHPKFPSFLWERRQSGQVNVQFVVDTLGRVDPATIEVLSSSNDSFTSAVKDVFPHLRFYAAEVDGKKVRQLVQQSFRFEAPQ